MKFKLYFIIAIFLSAFNLNAQAYKNKFNLEVIAPQHKGQTAYLLKYWNEVTYIIDSCQISKQGKGFFHKENSLPTGQYVLFIKPNVQLDLLLDEKTEAIIITLSKDIINSKIKGSEDTEILWDYIKHLNIYNEKKAAFNAQNNDIKLSESDKKENIKKLNSLNKEFDDYLHQLLKNKETTWAGDFIKGMTSVSLPYELPQNNEEVLANNQYVKQHYFDNLSLTNPNLLRTNYFWSYLDNYLDNWVTKNNIDSLAYATSDLVAKSMGNKTCFEQILMRYINKAINSKQMGMENVWSKLAEDYIFDKNYTKVDSVEISALRSQYELIKYNRLGMVAHELRLETIKGDTIQLHDVDAQYIILYFYDPTCSYCLAETESIQKNLYPKYKDKGLKIVTVNIYNDEKAWKDFINQNNISDWINCADPLNKSKYWMFYNTSGVPSVYVLDEDKKIIAKGIDEKGLEQVFNILYKENGTN